MQKIQPFSRAFLERFHSEPCDSVPVFFTNPAPGFSLTAGTESSPIFDEDVPVSVNGFRLSRFYLQGNVGVLAVRIYCREVMRNPSGATFNTPTYIEHYLSAGNVPFGFDIKRLLLPGDHWQATLYNPGIGTISNCWLGITGWYF